MAPLLSTERLARASARRPWLVLALWGALFVAAAVLGSGIGGVLTTEQRFLSEPNSVRTQRLLEQRLQGPRTAHELVIVQPTTRT